MRYCGRTFRNKLGFTLIELVCVFAVIAVLTAITVPVVSANEEKRNRNSYREACDYVCREADSICLAVNNGIHSVSGYMVCAASATDFASNMTNFEGLLNDLNNLDYKFGIAVLPVAPTTTVVGKYGSNDVVEVVIDKVNNKPPYTEGNSDGRTLVTKYPRTVISAYYYLGSKKRYVYKFDFQSGSGELL